MNFSARGENPENSAVPPTLYHIGECRDCVALNFRLSARLRQLRPADVIRRSHCLGGRYENIYLALESIPEIRVILDLATAQAAHLLNRAKKILSLGWWINIMHPGDVTYPHTHDDGEEWLSGVYYIDVPADSGKLVLIHGQQRVEITPRAGSFVFFAPDLLHEVTRNESARPRISVGFNVGPAWR